MDQVQILNSGILEQYVLGELNMSERQRIESAISQFPELRSALEEIEISFEKLALENAITAPSSVKAHLLENIQQADAKTPVVENSFIKNNYLNIAASAAAILCVACIYLYTQLNSSSSALEMADKQNEELKGDFEDLNEQLVETNKWFSTVNDPDTEKYVLKGNALSPTAVVIGYVNNIKRTVWVNTEQLPQLDDEHDYQMWADVDGAMVDMGVIGKSGNMIALDYKNNATSLNVTIEPAGGNDHPTVSQLVTTIFLR